MANWVALNSLAKGQFMDASGNVQVSRSVNVYLRGTTAFPTGGVAPNPDGSGTPLTQPLTTDANGDVPGYIQAGQSIDFYDVLLATRKQGEALSAGGNSTANVPPWTANTYYPANFVVVQSGILWQANAAFTSGSSFNAANWTALTAAGTELFSAKITSNWTSSGSSFQASPLVVTFTAPARPVKLEFYAYTVGQTGATGIPTLYICDNSGTKLQYIQPTIASLPAGATTTSLYGFTEVSTLTAGTSYSFKIYTTTTAGSVIIYADPTYPAIFRAEQV